MSASPRPREVTVNVVSCEAVQKTGTRTITKCLTQARTENYVVMVPETGPHGSGFERSHFRQRLPGVAIAARYGHGHRGLSRRGHSGSSCGCH